MKRRARHERRAFTLFEAALATVIVGTGVMAIMEAQQAFLQKNAWSTHTSTAMFLANEIREMTRNMPRHDQFSGGLYFEDPVAHAVFQGWGPELNELTAADFDDIDDFDGVVFGNAPNLPGAVNAAYPGPINAFTDVLPQISWNGAVVVDQNGDPISLQGWTQYIEVDKVDPSDFTVLQADDFFVPAVGTTPEREVDDFPIRVKVTILYQSINDLQAQVISEVSWIVPAI
jgi:hypothetical protein